MRFLADAGVSPDTVAFLTRLGHDAIHVRPLDMHRAQDLKLVVYARFERGSSSRSISTLGNILALGVLDRPSVILLRLSGFDMVLGRFQQTGSGFILSTETVASHGRQCSAALGQR